jgi:hypothetical protein
MDDTYFTYNALESQRSSGYRNTTYALAELIDNSFDAGANNCKIIFIERRGRDGRKFIDEILISDDGSGMDDDTLAMCLKFGGGTNFDIEKNVAHKKIGKFGYGLPNASLSQCPSVEVISWNKTDNQRKTKLILSELKQKESISVPPIESVNFPEHYGKIKAVISSKHGTIVSWKDCDRLSNTKSETIMKKGQDLLGLLFRHLLSSGKNIELISYDASSVEGYAATSSFFVKKNDPLFLMPDTVISEHLHNAANKTDTSSEYYKKYSNGKDRCLATNVKLEDESYEYSFSWQGKGYRFQITTTRVHDEIQKPGIRAGGDTLVGSFYKRHEKECISFVRSERQIAADNFGFYNQADPRQRWWSIEVSFDADADELLGVHNNKQGVDFYFTDEVDPTEVFDEHTASLQQAREQLWHELTKRLERARKAAWKEILAGHKRFVGTLGQPTDEGPPLPGGTPITDGIVGTTEGERQSQFSEDDKSELFERLQARYSEIDPDDIRKAIELYDKSRLRGCVLYAASESDRLWSITNIQDFLIILINTNHLFYEKMMGPLKEANQESALSAIELFISSLGWEEYTNFSTGQNSKIIEEYRSYVGLHLNRYLQEFELTDEFPHGADA